MAYSFYVAIMGVKTTTIEYRRQPPIAQELLSTMQITFRYEMAAKTTLLVS
jgi:hypothetical protein